MSYKILFLFALGCFVFGNAQISKASTITHTQTTQETEIAPINSSENFGTPLVPQQGNAIGGEVHDIQGLISDLGARVTKNNEIIVTLDADVLFDFDKADIKPVMNEKLSKLSKLIILKKTTVVEIRGYTDSKGADEYNYNLSVRRATVVSQWLTQNGHVNPTYLRPVGFGETDPVAPNMFADGSDNPQGRAKNRRVEVILYP